MSLYRLRKRQWVLRSVKGTPVKGDAEGIEGIGEIRGNLEQPAQLRVLPACSREKRKTPGEPSRQRWGRSPGCEAPALELKRASRGNLRFPPDPFPGVYRIGLRHVPDV